MFGVLPTRASTTSPVITVLIPSGIIPHNASFQCRIYFWWIIFWTSRVVLYIWSVKNIEHWGSLQGTVVWANNDAFTSDWKTEKSPTCDSGEALTFEKTLHDPQKAAFTHQFTCGAMFLFLRCNIKISQLSQMYLNSHLDVDHFLSSNEWIADLSTFPAAAPRRGPPVEGAA